QLPGFCERGTCRSGALGDPCGAHPAVDCRSGLYCAIAAGVGTCQAKARGGDPCSASGSCGDGLAGDPAAGTCAPWLDLMAACDAQRGPALCPRSTTCDSTAKQCLAPAVAAEGAACTRDAQCSGNLWSSTAYCDSNTLKCTPRPRFGDACIPPAPGG